MNLQDLKIDHTWTLFLDRDGVINERNVGGYVTHPSEFHFLPGIPDAIAKLSAIFSRIIIVTNQQGIGKGLMSEADLKEIHNYMLTEIKNHGGRVDAVLHCPDLATKDPNCRKPHTGMAKKAMKLFPGISPSKSIMVGDMPSDMGFARNAGMHAVWCGSEDEKKKIPESWKPDLEYRNLNKFANSITV